jgi:hypothetical protein
MRLAKHDLEGTGSAALALAPALSLSLALALSLVVVPLGAPTTLAPIDPPPVMDNAASRTPLVAPHCR